MLIGIEKYNKQGAGWPRSQSSPYSKNTRPKEHLKKCTPHSYFGSPFAPIPSVASF